MTTKRWCTKCGTDPAWWLWRSGEHVGCGGRVIPIATLCDPPEPTTIDKSDLAPGMVVVAVDDHDGLYSEWLCTPDAHLSLGRYQQLVWARRQEPHWYRDGVIVDRYVRRTAGKGLPC